VDWDEEKDMERWREVALAWESGGQGYGSRVLDSHPYPLNTDYSFFL
jgi:hypothetical protein